MKSIHFPTIHFPLYPFPISHFPILSQEIAWLFLSKSFCHINSPVKWRSLSWLVYQHSLTGAMLWGVIGTRLFLDWFSSCRYHWLVLFRSVLAEIIKHTKEKKFWCFVLMIFRNLELIFSNLWISMWHLQMLLCIFRYLLYK